MSFSCKYFFSQEKSASKQSYVLALWLRLANETVSFMCFSLWEEIFKIRAYAIIFVISKERRTLPPRLPSETDCIGMFSSLPLLVQRFYNFGSLVRFFKFPKSNNDFFLGNEGDADHYDWRFSSWTGLSWQLM